MWFLIDSIREKLEQAEPSKLTAEQQAEIVAAARGNRRSGQLQVDVFNGEGTIAIDGILTDSFDFMAFLFGGGMTLYPDIINALEEAEKDDNVETIVLDVNNSPGGSITGLFATIDAVKNTKKPVKAYVSNMAASATYGLISQADEIAVLNNASRVGSIGVVSSHYVDKREVEIASTDAPKKRPDITTEEGKAVVREQVDKMHDLFVDAISSGRKVSAGFVNKNFGRGAVVLAKDALKAGMIDRIGAVDQTVISMAASDSGEEEAGFMDLQEFKAKHPDVYAAAVQAGVDQERDRVVGHTTLGKASGDMETAMQAIEEGSGLTATLQAKYLAASMRRKDIELREEDNQEIDVPAEDSASTDSMGNQVATLVEKLMGVQGGGV
jgi:ClpP class serine protease